MKTEDIDQLLARFYAGETTEAEEEALKHYFACDDVPARFHADQTLFRQLAAPPVPRVPDGLESRLSALIDRQDEADARNGHRHPYTLRLRRIAGIAAMLCLLSGIGLYFLRPAPPPPTPQDTCATPEEAYREAQKALSLLACGLERGRQELEHVRLTTEKVHTQINRHLNQLKNLPQ